MKQRARLAARMARLQLQAARAVDCLHKVAARVLLALGDIIILPKATHTGGRRNVFNASSLLAYGCFAPTSLRWVKLKLQLRSAAAGARRSSHATCLASAGAEHMCGRGRAVWLRRDHRGP